MANSQNLEDMKLSELKELAKQIGLRGTSTMRKPELLATLKAARDGGQAPQGVSVRPLTATVNSAQQAPTNTTTQRQSQGVLEVQAAEPEPQNNDQRAAKLSKDQHTDAAESQNSEQSYTRASRRLHSRDEQSNARRAGAGNIDDAVLNDAEIDSVVSQIMGLVPTPTQKNEQNTNAGQSESNRDRDLSRRTPNRPLRRRRAAESILETQPEVQSHQQSEQSEGEESHDDSHMLRRRRRNDQNVTPVRRHREENVERTSRNEERNSGVKSESFDVNSQDSVDDLTDILATLPGRPQYEQEHEEYDERDSYRANANNTHARRPRRDAEETVEEDELVPVAGIIDVMESYAFVRTSGYLPGPNDVYVSMGQIKKYGLRKGDAVHGTIRPPREGERRNQRQKFVPLQAIDSINGMSVEEAQNRPHFSKLTPLYPQERLKQETTSSRITGRLIDIVAPIGKGQRGLIVSPPKAGKTITLQNIANAITTNNPEVHLMVVLVDERPEEVTDMERTVQGEVISSTFDRPASDHTTVAELAIERAKRLVELGQDVVVLLDSMTRLARAYNIAVPTSGRILSGGVDAQALYPPKKFFGAARNIENGGSLTIISSALVETGSKMDEVIFEEFKGTGNMELKLSRELADKRLFPAIDVNSSGTRREELITPADELPVIYRLRRLLGGLEPEQAYQTLVPRLKKTPTNRDFLAAIVQQQSN